jgi:hypothetical protein
MMVTSTASPTVKKWTSWCTWGRKDTTISVGYCVRRTERSSFPDVEHYRWSDSGFDSPVLQDFAGQLLESGVVASTETYLDTPVQVVEPGAPGVTYLTTGGTHVGGDYYYGLSAYVGLSTNESKVVNTIYKSVVSTTLTNKITLSLPTLPSGASGFNVYRRAPGESKYFYLASVDMTVATPPTTYVDTGSVTVDFGRTLPVKNTTNSSNSVTITYPGATPIVPTGYTWKIYRTYVNSNYARSLLKQVVEYSGEATPTILTSYVDTGINTSVGEPKTSTTLISNPSKIDFDDAAEVENVLPPANIVFRHIEEWIYDGVLSVRTGTYAWVCPFEEAYIIGVRCNLGVGYVPASTAVIIDVNKYNSTAATPSWSTIYSTQANRPRVLVGAYSGALTVPNTRTLVSGDMLSVDIDQAGGGATPTDRNLLVQVLMYFKDSTATSIDFP